MKTRQLAIPFLIVCVVLTAALSAMGQQVTLTGKVDFSGVVADKSGVVVWLNPVGAEAQTPSPEHRQLIQKNKTFSPHLLVIPVGSSVDFPNQDPFFHNVFSLFEGKRFDLGLYEAGSTRTVVFSRVGISYIFCNIHPEMSAVVVSVKTPYYAISDRAGHIGISNVPPGRYELHVWHERVLPETLSGLTRTVVVSETSNSLGPIRLTEQRSLSHKNKYGHDYDPLPAGTAYPKP